MGNTCKPMAVSFQCMTKFTTKKKKKKKQSKINIIDVENANSTVLSIKTKMQNMHDYFN